MKMNEYQKAITDHIANLDSVVDAGDEGGKPKPETVEVKDTRKKLAATGADINREKDLKSGHYNKQTLKNIIKAAKHVGIDPNTAMAVALQESHFGNLNPENLGNVYASYNKIPEGIDRQSYEMVQFLKEKMEEGKKMGIKDEATLLQTYNGLGKLGPQKLTVNGQVQYQPTKYYGIEVTKDKPLDLKKNPLYGKTIIDLRDNILKQNQEIQALVKGL